MKEKNYKPLMPDLMEAIFDAGYLIFDLIAGDFIFRIFKRKYVIRSLWYIDIDTLRRRRISSGSENYQSCAWK